MLLVIHFTFLFLGLLKKENHILTLEVTKTLTTIYCQLKVPFVGYFTMLDYAVLNSKMINYWKEHGRNQLWFQVLIWHLPGGTEETPRKHQDSQYPSWDLN
jgi:hypothetical protein